MAVELYVLMCEKEIAMEAIYRNRHIISTTKDDRLWFTSIFTVLLAGTISLKGVLGEAEFQALLALTGLLAVIGISTTLKSLLTHFYFVSHTMFLRDAFDLGRVIPPMAYEDDDDPWIMWPARVISVAGGFLFYYTLCLAGSIAYLVAYAAFSSPAFGPTWFAIMGVALTVLLFAQAVGIVWLRKRIYNRWNRHPSGT